LDFSKLSREDWLVGGGGILLAIDLLFLPWYHVTIGLISVSAAATSAPDGFWGVLALLVTIAIVVDLGLALFSPQTQLPTTPLGREMTRCVAAGLVLLFLLIKLIDHTSYLGIGVYPAFILAIAVAGGAYREAQGLRA
jgi:hypothetical protein